MTATFICPSLLKMVQSARPRASAAFRRVAHELISQPRTDCFLKRGCGGKPPSRILGECDQAVYRAVELERARPKSSVERLNCSARARFGIVLHLPCREESLVIVNEMAARLGRALIKRTLRRNAYP